MNSKSSNIEWSTTTEAFQLFFRGVTIQACIPVALVVGMILSVINQYDVLISGGISSITWIKVGLNFIVPFCVSSYGYLNARRL